ncbi:hypothetical protein PTKIN_Ptkin08bG0118800 [Pterospermum kingtungense]
MSPKSRNSDFEPPPSCGGNLPGASSYNNGIYREPLGIIVTSTVLYDLLFATGLHEKVCSGASSDSRCEFWHIPPSPYLKYNTYAAVFSDVSLTGLGIVIRNASGDFIVGWMAAYSADAVNGGKEDSTEFGSIVRRCRLLLSSNNTHSVCYVRRRAKFVTHALAQ